MAEIICVRMCWQGTAPPLPAPGFHNLTWYPEPDHPFGRRGLAMLRGWSQLSSPATAGMLCLDGDVAIDPHDRATMFAAIDARPAAVHVGPVRIWPASTKQPGWTWGHGRGQLTRENVPDPDIFGFSFTYLPRALLESCEQVGMRGWCYPRVDVKVRQRASAIGIKAYTVPGCFPKHLNF